MRNLKDATCDKCGSKDLSAQWYRPVEAHFHYSMDMFKSWDEGQPERMVRRCQKCSYLWVEWEEWVYPMTPRPESPPTTFRWWKPWTWFDRMFED